MHRLLRSRVPADRLLDEPETASVIRVSSRTVRRLAARGDLPRLKVGKSTRYRESDVQAYIRDLGPGPAALSDVERLLADGEASR